MTRRRHWLLAATLAVTQTAIVVTTAPTTASAASCTRTETPPPPPPRGAVLWSPPQAGSTAANTIVLNFGDIYDDHDNCGSTLDKPWVISVAEGAALAFLGTKDFSQTLVSPWGAVSVPSPGSGPIELVPAGWDWRITRGVAVWPPADLLSEFGSCRRCDLSNANVVLPGFPESDTTFAVAFPGDVSGATWHGATITGSGSDLNGRGYDFSGSDLSGATFSASVENAMFGTVTANATRFAGADLRGATVDRMQFDVPPSFAGATLGGNDVSCTSIANTNLLNASLGAVTWEFEECVGALFPGSQVPVLTLRHVLVDADFKGHDLGAGAIAVASAADRAALAGTDLRGANLADVSFLGEPVDLTGTRLDGATLTGSNFARARLAGATLTNVSAAGASFQGADLAADGTHPAANFSGPNTNLQGANFVDANVSGASFVGADLTGALFTGARGVDTDFSGVRARNAVFADAHLYGNGQAFNRATDMQNVDFTGAVLAGDASESGGFDFTGAPLTGAHFDRAVCVACNLTNATLDGATFTDAYLPGVVLSGATLSGASFDRAWLYCGSLSNDWCASVPGAQPLWAWPLALGSPEVYGPVPFAATDLSGVDLAVVRACPDGKSGAIVPAGCPHGHLLPNPSEQPPLPAPCSASAYGGCPTATSTLLQATARPLAVVPAVPPTWSTALSGEGYYVGLDDATLRLVGSGTAAVVAGTAGAQCLSATEPCGDGGPATAALLGRPSGLAVGLDGSLYIADPHLRRVRSIAPSGTITTVAGTGDECSVAGCGDGGPARSAQLAAANAVAVDPYGVLLIADGTAGVRRVAVDGTISTLAPGAKTGDVVAVANGADGTIYAATRNPDHIIQIEPTTGAVTPVVGTGTSGYNGNTNELGLLLPGTQVQINQPGGLSVDLDGNVVFADTANHLIRAYVPSTGHVIDDLAGVITDGAPQGGFNGDGHWATDTQLNQPLAVAATRGPLLIIADTGNQRVRQVGPAPPDTVAAPRRAEVVISCRVGSTWTCERLPSMQGAATIPQLGAVTITHQDIDFAAGGWLVARRGRLRFLVTEQQPLVPGSYELVIHLAGRELRRAIQLTQGP